MVILQNNLFLSCILFLQPFPYKQNNYKKIKKNKTENIHVWTGAFQNIVFFDCIRVEWNLFKNGILYNVAQTNPQFLKVHDIQIKKVCHKFPKSPIWKMITFSFTSNSCIRSQTMGGKGGGVVYCSTMCQYNKWNYPHRDSIIMPCIDQWTLTGSMSCVGVRICLSPEFPSVSSRAPWSLSVSQWLSPRWTSPSGASGEC